jgi:hypothetical protein
VVRVVDRILIKLEGTFHGHGIMDSFGVVYPQYWLYSNVEKKFNKHVKVIKGVDNHPKKVGNNDL